MNAGILSSSAPAALRPQTECYHCGLPLPRDVHFATTIDSVERALCCAGCQAVAQIIVDHGLISYYRHRSALPARGQTAPLAVRELAAYDVPEVERALTRDAGNHVREAAPFFRGAWRDVRHWQLGMDVPVALGIGAAFAASVAATVTGSGRVYFDSVTMFVFLLLAARYLEMTARTRAAMTQEQLAQQAPAVAERFAAWPGSDLAEMVAAGRLHVGDHLRIRPGAAVPADGVVVDGASEVDESLLSGDRPQIARHIARRLGIAAVLGGATPHDKLDYVQRLQRDGAIVAMVGDGVNDAAGLATAQVSIAMGGGADIACSNSDVILLSDPRIG